MNTTFALLKPDCVERGLAPKIVRALLDSGFTVRRMESVLATPETSAQHFEHLKRVGFEVFQRNLSFFSGKTVVLLSLSAENAVAKLRNLCGPTDPTNGTVGELRFDYSDDTLAMAISEVRGLRNIIHASDTHAAACLESRLWFSRAHPFD